MALSGPDCSRYQGNVNWSAVRAAGHSFAILKATEGTGYAYIGWYQGNAPKVLAAGLTLGAYHFLRTGDGAAQARYFRAVIGDPTGILTVLDVETAANGTKPTISDVREFVGEFHRIAPGHPLIIYTGRWYWVGVMGNPHGADLGPLWHSEYESSPNSGPDLDNYGGWSGATIWQWTSSGSCPGVSGRCDLNVFYGNHDDLAVLTGAKLGGGPIPKPIPTTGDLDMPIIIAAEGRPAALLSGNEMVAFGDQSTLGGLNGNGVPTCVVSVADYDRFWQGFTWQTDQDVRDVEARGELRMQHLQNLTAELLDVEKREEQRDAEAPQA